MPKYNKMIDYIRDKELEDIITISLVDNLKYLLAIREELTSNLKELDAQIDEIIVDMGKVGIELP